MTVVEPRVVRASGAHAPPWDVVAPVGPEGRSIVDTTELRWFVPGPLSPAVEAWFAGSTGVPEVRCDSYLLRGRVDVGVKRRCQEILEVKVRRALTGPIELGGRTVGPLEVWRKWHPDDGFDADLLDGQWVDVVKSIVKRRFSPDGSEVAYSSVMTGSGCDVEIADVTVGSVRSWTFAFASFGPETSRLHALLAAWNGVLAGPHRPESFGPLGATMGYPQWLTTFPNAQCADRE